MLRYVVPNNVTGISHSSCASKWLMRWISPEYSLIWGLTKYSESDSNYEVTVSAVLKRSLYLAWQISNFENSNMNLAVLSSLLENKKKKYFKSYFQLKSNIFISFFAFISIYYHVFKDFTVNKNVNIDFDWFQRLCSGLQNRK